MDKNKQKKFCIECDVETDDYYPASTNRGKIFRCSGCHEQWVRTSVKLDSSPASLKSSDP